MRIRSSLKVLLLSSALGVLFALCPASGDQGAQIGAIRGWSYCEFYSDPAEIAEGIRICAILEIRPPIHGRRYFVTDPRGSFRVPAVPAGEYLIQPLHCPARYAVEVRVAAGKISEVTVPTPQTGLYLYLVNCAGQDPPLSRPEVRRALALALDRPKLLAAAGVVDREPAYDFIPLGLRGGGWAEGADGVGYAPEQARELLEGTTSFSIRLAYNATETNQSLAVQAGSFLESLPGVANVTLVGKTWNLHVDDYTNGDFDLLRMGWALDSNNILEFYRVYFGEGNRLGYSNPGLLKVMDWAQQALDQGNIADYESAILTINSILVAEMPAIPIFHY